MSSEINLMLPAMAKALQNDFPGPSGLTRSLFPCNNSTHLMTESDIGGMLIG